jgi:tetratricopeptide (TPR) repeat protein
MRLASVRRVDAAVVAAAALAHFGFLVATRADPVFRVPYLDGAFYHTWARSLAEGRGDFQGPYFLGPLYPYALSLLYRLFGPEPMAARAVQSVLGVLDAWLVLQLGRHVFGTAAGVAAAALCGLYGPLVFHANLLVMELLLLTLGLAALVILVVPGWSGVRRGALAGALLGLATLGRPTVLVAAPLAWMALQHPAPARGARRASARRRMRLEGRAVAACSLAWLVVLAPVLVRNARLGAGPVVSTNGGVNFYAGNSPDANGRFRAPPGVEFFTAPVFGTGSENLPTAVAARALTVGAVAGTDAAADSRAWMARARAWILAQPGDWVALLLRKAWLVLQAREVAQIESYDFNRERLKLLRAFAVDFSWIWPLAALGVWRARRERRRGAALVAGWAAAMLFPCIAFFVTSRYRLSAVPPLAVLAGGGAATLGAWLVQRQGRRLALAALVLVPIAAVTRMGGAPPRGAAGWERAQMAERLYALGDLEGAIAWQERAAAVLPERYEVQLNLALYWSERARGDDVQRAEALLRQVVQQRPRSDRALALVLFNLGAVLEQQGRTAEARAQWAAALRLDPSLEAARQRLGGGPPGPP